MQSFFTNTIEYRFISNLLYETYLPIFKSVNDGDIINKGFLYTYKNSIIKCDKTGVLNTQPPVATYHKITSYNFGDNEVPYCRNYVDKDVAYNSELHEALGNYLRYYRDIYDINLMPLYNCFSYRQLEDYDLHSNYPYINEDKNSSNKIFIVPIKYDTEYTIALDSTTDVLLLPMIVNKKE